MRHLRGRVSCHKALPSTLPPFVTYMRLVPLRTDFTYFSELPINPVSMTGIYHIHLFPASYQFSRWRTFPDNYDAWSNACTSPVASYTSLGQSRHLRPSHISRHQARDSAVRVAETRAWNSYDHYEGYRHLPGGVSRAKLWLPVE